jgi:hypothetical protein
MMFGIMAGIWYYTHYVLRKSLKKIIIEAGTREKYKEVEQSKRKSYLLLSILIFFLVFFVFFAASVWTIGGYDKRWPSERYFDLRLDQHYGRGRYCFYFCFSPGINQGNWTGIFFFKKN